MARPGFGSNNALQTQPPNHLLVEKPQRSVRYVQDFTLLSMLKHRHGRVFNRDIRGRDNRWEALQA